MRAAPTPHQPPGSFESRGQGFVRPDNCPHSHRAGRCIYIDTDLQSPTGDSTPKPLPTRGSLRSASALCDGQQPTTSQAQETHLPAIRPLQSLHFRIDKLVECHLIYRSAEVPEFVHYGHLSVKAECGEGDNGLPSARRTCSS
jgi:hypothetical protein